MVVIMVSILYVVWMCGRLDDEAMVQFLQLGRVLSFNPADLTQMVAVSPSSLSCSLPAFSDPCIAGLQPHELPKPSLSLD